MAGVDVGFDDNPDALQSLAMLDPFFPMKFL
jgi:hypothetical protein